MCSMSSASCLLEVGVILGEIRHSTVLIREETPGGPAWDERVFQGDETIVGDILPGFRGAVAELWIDAELDEGDED